MNINFKWVHLESLDSDKLKNYCFEEREEKFCWWISGDLTNDNKSYNEVIELVNTGKYLVDIGERLNQNEWRGNQYWISLCD